MLAGPAGTPQIYAWEFDQPIIYLKISLPEALNDTATGTDSEALVKILSHGGSRCGALITNSVVHQLLILKSFAGAADTAQRYPRYASQITAAAK